ncbi:unnamed protein product [Clavelina lepadiformis]|uniref:Uncharacterized protein n=1 Tax=Clavelina lepadiformis TaxID=159417 RepID=A0ABP0H5Q1_CLALP
MEFTTRFGLHSQHQPDSEKTPSTHANRRHGPDTPLWDEASIRRTRAIRDARKTNSIRHNSRSAPKATGFGDGLIPLHSPLLRESSPKCKRRHTCRGSTTFAIDRGDLAKRGHLFEVDPPPPRSPIACRTLADFDGTAETQVSVRLRIRPGDRRTEIAFQTTLRRAWSRD